MSNVRCNFSEKGVSLYFRMGSSYRRQRGANLRPGPLGTSPIFSVPPNPAECPGTWIWGHGLDTGDGSSNRW